MTRYRRAAKAFEAFTGARPSGVESARLPPGDVVGWKLGPAVGVAYEATRDGQKSQYFHEFDQSSRPDLVASEDGRQLFFANGKYTVTARGIEDVPELFIVNPSARRKAKGQAMTTKRARNGQFLKGGRRAAPKRRRAHAPRQVAVFRANPTKRRRRRLTTSRRTVRRFRRNPSGLGVHSLAKMIMPAAGVGAGAVGAEMLMGYLPIPAEWKSGVLRQVTKGAVGLAAGWALGKFFKQKRLGFYVMAGAVVIAVHDAIKEAITSRMPNNQGAFGQYVSPLASQFAGRGMGYVNPALTSRFGQYVQAPASQFGGDTPIFRHPGGETEFAA